MYAPFYNRHQRFQRLGIRTRKEGLYQYLREIKTKVDFLQNEQSELVGFTFYLVDEDKETCAKLRRQGGSGVIFACDA